MIGSWWAYGDRFKPIPSGTVSADPSAPFPEGIGVYETLKVRGGVLYFVERHARRLLASASYVGLAPPSSTDAVAAVVTELVRRNAIADANVRLRLVPLGSDASVIVAYLVPPIFVDPAWYRDGVDVTSFYGERFLPEAKSDNTLVNNQAYRYAKAQGCFDAVLVDSSGYVAEGSRTNLFATDGQSVFSPPEHRALGGVTRSTLLEALAEQAIPVAERPISLTLLRSGRLAAWLTGTSTVVLPIRSVDGRPLPRYTLVERVRQHYDGFLRRYADGEIPVVARV